jgi:hypothetical protein
MPDSNARPGVHSVRVFSKLSFRCIPYLASARYWLRDTC